MKRPMYEYTTELPGVWDSWRTATDFIQDMKCQHPKVVITHIGRDTFCQRSDNLGDLYAVILQGVGEDHQHALSIVKEAVTWR